MPELPEVETIVRELHQSHLLGVQIVRAEVFWPRIIEGLLPQQFCDRMRNQTILTVQRRAKYIHFGLSQGALLIHLRMTGKLSLGDLKTPLKKHEHIRLVLSDQRVLIYEDQRKFGRFSFVENVSQKFAKLGLEPLSDQFTFEAFLKLFEKRKTKIKPFLLNQSYIAGLGNIYVDEALWEARIHPERKLEALSRAEIRALFQSIPLVLYRGVENKGTSLGTHQSNYFNISGERGGNQYKLNVFRQEGKACPRCRSLLIKIVVAQRGTHLCANCQN
jgi:formamidopyrimidine-DNA glycosylase